MKLDKFLRNHLKWIEEQIILMQVDVIIMKQARQKAEGKELEAYTQQLFAIQNKINAFGVRRQIVQNVIDGKVSLNEDEAPPQEEGGSLNIDE